MGDALLCHYDQREVFFINVFNMVLKSDVCVGRSALVPFGIGFIRDCD